MKLIIGKKYVPHSKNAGCKGLGCSRVWERAQINDQKYLYYTGFDTDSQEHCFDEKYIPGYKPNGDYFLESDVTEYIENINPNNMKRTFTVDEEFILAAYKAACNEWQEKIKNKFPELFRKSPIEIAIENVGTKVYGYPVTFEGSLVKIPLPNANREWSLAVFEYVQNFIEKYPASYPRHDKHLKTDEFMYIEFNY